MGLGIVTGGSGFIGTQLIRHLWATGRHERILSLDIARPAERLQGVVYQQADITHAIDPLLGVEGAVIYHLAALRDYPGHPEPEYKRVNAEGTRRVIEFAELCGVRTIVFTSSMTVYGTQPGRKTEGSPLVPENAYGNAKLDAEHALRRWLSGNDERRLIISRPAVIFGPGENGNYTRLARALERGYFVYPGRRNTRKSAGYVADLVQSFDFCLDSADRSITCNFAFPEAPALQAVVEAMCETGGFRRPSISLPAPALNALARPFEWLNAAGFANPVNRERIAKLTAETDIAPQWLTKNGFIFETDLNSALARWWNDAPAGRFE